MSSSPPASEDLGRGICLGIGRDSLEVQAGEAYSPSHHWSSLTPGCPS